MSPPSACTSSIWRACASWTAPWAGRSTRLRFRANLYLEGVEPWAEFGWLDRAIGIGPARLSVFARTSRCEATNVDPAKGVRDMAIPSHLQRTWGHQDFGIYAKVGSGGEISVGMPVAIPA